MGRIRSRILRAFTLVELLVVIGIIALLIGVLLPVLSGIAARGRDLQCQSNIRQCVTLILAYASENKGQLPYGFYYTPRNSTLAGWGPVGGNEWTMIHLWSVVSRVASSTYPLEDKAEPPMDQRPAFLRCPEASLVRPHLCSYVGNLPAFITPSEDAYYGATPPPSVPWTLIERPTKTTQLLPFTVLVWETNVTEGMRDYIGWITGWGVDRFGPAGATTPQYRYYSSHDPFAHISPGLYGNNRPITMFSEWRNDDPSGGGVWGFQAPGYEGTPRFRHNRNTTCNAGYADGHAERFTGKFKKDGRPISHDAIRKHFMVKWPTGIAPNPNVPH